MKPCRFSLALVATAALVSTAFQPSIAQSAQSQSSAPLAASASTAVPALVPYSGTLTEIDGKLISNETAVTFLIFKDQSGGEPLFAETQAITPDSTGHYRIQLGATLPNGLPTDLFSTGEARWLEIQAAGHAPQSRVLMASVPYALKAADSATLGGLPASAFVLAGSKAAGFAADATSAAATTASSVTTTGGTSGYVPEFTGANTIADSPIFVSGANVGIGTTTPTTTLDVKGTALISGALTASGGATIGGQLSLPAAGAATAATGQSSHTFTLSASAFNSSTAKPVTEEFEWKAEPAGNDTATPLGTLNLLSSTGGSLAETGFHFNANGTINFASGQTFPGTGTGNGTITGVTAGTGLTGGGTTGNVPLAVNQSVVAFQSDLTSAENTLNANIAAAQAAAISASEQYAFLHYLGLSGGGIQGNLYLQGSTNSTGTTLPVYAINAIGGDGSGGAAGETMLFKAGNGSSYFEYAHPEGSGTPGGTGSSITLEPGAGSFGYGDNGGNGGQIILQPGVGGVGSQYYEAAPGINGNVVIIGDDNGAARGTPQQLMIQGQTNSNQQLLIGYLANGQSNGYGAIQATLANTVNTPLLLNPNGGGVGIQTTAVTNSLTIGQGQGGALADAWYTYSSRRFKTDIQTLPDALDKVEKLRGVSYTLKATGKREIGVIAEEVGSVVPEVVNYEANGKDARSVDYARLTALLIEATKQQQAEIAKQQNNLDGALRQIKIQQKQIRQQEASISSLKTQVHSGEEALKQVRHQLTDRRASGEQPTLVAAR